jgi:hypothetical protein
MLDLNLTVCGRVLTGATGGTYRWLEKMLDEVVQLRSGRVSVRCNGRFAFECKGECGLIAAFGSRRVCWSPTPVGRRGKA